MVESLVQCLTLNTGYGGAGPGEEEEKPTLRGGCDTTRLRSRTPSVLGRTQCPDISCPDLPTEAWAKATKNGLGGAL